MLDLGQLIAHWGYWAIFVVDRFKEIGEIT